MGHGISPQELAEGGVGEVKVAAREQVVHHVLHVHNGPALFPHLWAQDEVYTPVAYPLPYPYPVHAQHAEWR